MKKYLYATTAIIGVTAVATGAQAQGVDANIGGFINGYYGVADIDNGTNDDTQELNYQEAELNITGSVTLDNGVEAGVFIQNELEGGFAEADEQYLYMKGSFGTLRLGQQDSAAYWTSAFGSQPYAAGVPINSGWEGFANAFGNYDGNFLAPGYTTYGGLVDDDNGIVYFSPRVAGLQLGLSWHPDSGSGQGAFLSANGGTGGFINAVDENTSENNAITVGLNFSRDFNGIGIDASAGYATEDRDDMGSAAPRFDAAEDPNQYMGGLAVSVAGFSFGGDILIQDEGVRFAGNSNEGEAYSLGGSYSVGPWTAGLNGIYSEIEGDTSIDGDDSRLAISGGLDYAMGPGITLSSSVLYQEIGSEERGDGQTEILGGLLGATVSF